MSKSLMSEDDVARIDISQNSENSNSNESDHTSVSPNAPRTLQPPSISQLSPSITSTRKRRQFNGKAPATINFGALTQNTNRIPFSEVDSDTDTILRAVTKSQINQSPTLGRLNRTLFHLEQSGSIDNKNDNDFNYNFHNSNQEPLNIESTRKKMISDIEKVDLSVKKLARAFGATDTMTTFLAIAKNPKFVTNAEKTIPHAQDTFDQLERELKHIRIHGKLPKEIKGANTNVLQRLKSMRQAHTSDLPQSFLQNEFQNYASKIEKMSIFNISNNKNIKASKNKKSSKVNDNDIDDLMMIDNLNLKAKLANLQKHLIRKMENEKKADRTKRFASLNKPELIIQTKKMLDEIKKKQDLQLNAANSYALQMADFARKREELITSFNASNQQAKRLEIARKRMIDENAKIVTVKGKDYDLKMLDEEINSVFVKTDQIIKDLEKIESKEKKCIDSFNSNC